MGKIILRKNLVWEREKNILVKNTIVQLIYESVNYYIAWEILYLIKSYNCEIRN